MSGVGTIGAVVLDCPDPWALGRFWSEVVGLGVAEDSTDGWVDLVPGPGGWQLSFQRVKDYQPPTWPKGIPQQAHIDVSVADLAAAEEAVLSLGATTLSAPKGSKAKPWRVYADPAGHPFCLCTC